MKKIVQRFLVFIIGLPLITGIVLFLDYRSHLAVNILVILFSALGAVEFAAILGKKGLVIHPVEALILGILGPLFLTLNSSFGLESPALPLVYILGAFWLLVSRVFCPAEKLAAYTTRTAAGFSVMIYPGLFVSWIVRMTLFPGAGKVILAFLLMVFANDSAAWAVGMLFGRRSRGIISASPNKSIHGFAGGIAASILIGAGADIFLNDVFVSSRLPRIAAGILTGFCTAVAASLGDLAESALKRSSGIKDSGNLIPGRGGVLDTIDSISLAAPVFYLLYQFLYL
ncbi:MAG: phosphatidate cytidylyltransferase [Treponema sp.]|jgi:phosphatidate cytidylyltransferase|nr:phosphatidate cytidylyltransferase [Treponema sp.]